MFAKSFFLLMHTQYLTLSRMIGLKMNPHALKDRLDPKERERAMLLERIRTSIMELSKEADSMVAKYQAEIPLLFTNLVTREREAILDLARTIPVRRCVCCSAAGARGECVCANHELHRSAYSGHRTVRFDQDRGVTVWQRV